MAINGTRPVVELAHSSPGYLRRHRPAVLVGVAAILIAGVAAFLMSRHAPGSRQRETIFQVVTVIPPPPPPPPPRPPEQKMIEQPKMLTPERQPPQHVDASKPNAPAKAPGVDNSAGPNGGVDLAGTAGGDGTGLGDGGGSRWGWYATIVQEQVSQALRNNPKTRAARFRTEVRLWSDPSGRIQRVQLVDSTGDPNIDAVLTREVLQGLQLRQPPPNDMPMPIVMRVTGSATG